MPDSALNKRAEKPAPAPDFLKPLLQALHKARVGDDPRQMLTLRELSQETGLSQSTLCRVLAGKAPDLETFAVLCRWLGQSSDALLGITSPTNPVVMPLKRRKNS